MYKVGNIVYDKTLKYTGVVESINPQWRESIRVVNLEDEDTFYTYTKSGKTSIWNEDTLELLTAFRVGDRVKDLESENEGVIVEIDLDEKFYPIFALFPNGRNRYTLDGRAWLKSEKPSLIMVEQVEEDSNSLTTYELQTLQDLVYGRIYPTDCIPEEMLKLGQKLQRKMNSLLSFPRMMAFQSVDGDKWEFLFVTNLERDYDAKGYHRVNNGTLVESIREITAEEKEQILNSLNHQ
jgi:hypothetical protein